LSSPHQGPEQSGEHDVERDQDAGQEGHIAREQAEAGIDVAAEDFRKPVDDAEIVHGKGFPSTARTMAALIFPALRRCAAVVP
jgi:hypothetical protein